MLLVEEQLGETFWEKKTKQPQSFQNPFLLMKLLHACVTVSIVAGL